MVFGAFSLAGYELGQFRLSLPKTSIWNYQRLIPAGFFVEERPGDRLLFCRTDTGSKLILEAVKRQEELKSNQVSISANNGTIKTSQVISGVPRNGILNLNEGWNLQSVVDVWQDEFPLPINRRVTANGPILILSNEEDVIRVVAEKNIDPRNIYSVRDLLVIPNVQADSRVEFSSGFTDGKSVRILSSSGLPNEIKMNGQLESDLESVEEVRFLFSAEASLVSDELEYDITVDVHEGTVTTTYNASFPNQANNRHVIVGLGGIENWTAKPLRQKLGRIMSDVEKRLHGLETDRSFWMFSKPNTGRETSHVVAFKTQRFGNETMLNVPFPYSVLGMFPRGKIRFKWDDPNIQFDVDDLEEIPSDSQSDRSRQFVITGAEPRLVIKRGIDGEVDESISALSRRLFVRSNGTKHEQIETVYVRGRMNLDAVNQTNSFSASGSGQKLNVKDWFVFVLSSEHAISDAWVSIGDTELRGEQFEEEWRFKIPRPVLASKGNSKIVLNLNYSNDSHWLMSTDHGKLSIDGELVEFDYKSIEVSENFMGLHAELALSPTLRESIKSVLWLPLQICDTATAQDLLGSDYDSVTQSTSKGGARFFIRREIVISFGVCLFFLAVAYGVITRRLRWVLIFALISIACGTVLRGMPALVCCFFFWGFSLGAVVRELRQLSTFRRFVSFVVLLLAIVPLESNGQESDRGAESKTAANEKKIRYIVFPINKDKKTLGIGYLPRDLYELANQKSVSQPTLFHSSDIQVGVSRNSAEMQLLFSFEVTSYDGQITLPYLFDSAVYLEDSISVNGRQVDFVPDIKKQSVQISLPNNGRQTVSVSLSAPLPFKSLRIELPAPGLLQLVNGSTFDLVAETSSTVFGKAPQSAKKSTLRKKLPIGQKMFLRQNRSFMLSLPEKLPSVSILETDEISKNLFKKRVLLVNNELPIKEVQVSIPDGFKLDNNEDENLFVDQAANKMTILEIGKSQEIVFVKAVNSYGSYRFRPIEANDVEIQTHLLRVMEGQDVEIAANSIRASEFDSQDSAQVQLKAKWSAIENDFNLKQDASRPPTMIFDAKLELPTVQVSERGFSITGSSIQRHFLSNTSHRINAEFNVSFPTSLDSLSIILPDGFDTPTVELGEISLPIYQVAGNEFLVVTKELQAGAYRFVVRAQRKIASLDRALKSVEIRSAKVIATHQIWLDRGLKLNSSASLIKPLRREIKGRYLFFGTLGFDEGEIELTRNNESEKDVVSIEDEIRFKNGRVLHRVQLELNSNIVFGTRIGMEIPFDATNIQIATPSWEAIIEKSESFGLQQLWISPNLSPAKQVFITFESGLTGKGVGLPILIGQEIATKSVIVPRRFSDDELNWNMSDAKANGESLICRLPSSKDFLSYEIEERVEPSPSVDLAEFIYSSEESILTSLFYLSPNGSKSIRIQIPAGQFLHSVRLAGRTRGVSQVSKEVYRIDLLDQRFCQSLELSTRFPELGSKTRSIQLPQPIDWPVVLSFFQHDDNGSGFTPTVLEATNIAPATFNELDAARKKHFAKAVETFELNRSTLNDQFWRSALLKLSKVANVEFESSELLAESPTKDLLSESDSSRSEDSLQTGFSQMVSTGKPIWYSKEPGAVIQLSTKVSRYNPYWAITVIGGGDWGWRMRSLVPTIFPKFGSATFLFFVNHQPLVIQRGVGCYDAAVDFCLVFDCSCFLFGRFLGDKFRRVCSHPSTAATRQRSVAVNMSVASTSSISIQRRCKNQFQGGRRHDHFDSLNVPGKTGRLSSRYHQSK